MREEKDAIYRHYQALKGRMVRFRDGEARRLQELTLNSRGAIQALGEKLKKAEGILKLAELNRKMETEREKARAAAPPTAPDRPCPHAHALPPPPAARPPLTAAQVLPFYQSSVDDEASAAAQTVDMSTALQAGATGRDGKHVEEWDYLNQMFKRYNKVLLDELAISREKARLEQENADLRAILKQYLDGISVNDDVISDANPLLIMNSRSNVATLPARASGSVGRVAVIEAAHKVRIPMLSSGRQGASM